MVAKLVVLYLACAPAARAESGVGFLAGTITIVEGIFAGISYASSGMGSSGAGIQQSGRIAGGIELGMAALLLGRDARSREPQWAADGTIVALGIYNLAAVGSVPWRFALNELGLHAVVAAAYLDYRRNERKKSDAPSARLAPMPGGLALLGRF
jgi:hypothetical protein